MDNRIKNIVKEHIIILVVICSFLLAVKLLGLRCPIYMLLGIPCPTCGVTRAMVSLVRLDFASYLKYNPFALPLCISVWSMLEIKLFKRKMPVYIIALLTAVLNFVYYLYRLAFGGFSFMG